MEKFIENKNVKIYLNEKIVENSKSAILLIHGLAEHSGRYLDFIETLNNEGFSVFAMDLRGHGQTISKKGDSESIKKVLEDVDVVMKYIKSNHSFRKIGIFGHSVGGLVTSIYASSNHKIDFIVLSSPAIYRPKKLNCIKFVPYKLLPFIYLKKKHSESKEMLEYSKKDQFALHKFSLRTVGVFFGEGIRKLNKELNITIPTLLVYGKQDRLLNEEQEIQNFFDKLHNKNNKLIVYENAKHRIVQNEGKEKRIEDIISWIKEK